MVLPDRRPVSITFVGWLFIVVGCGGIASGALRSYKDVTGRNAAHVGLAHAARDFSFVVASGLLAIVGGFFVLRGRKAGRWLLVAWMAMHVVISIMHSLSQLAMHAVIFAVIFFFLYRPRASGFFRRSSTWCQAAITSSPN